MEKNDLKECKKGGVFRSLSITFAIFTIMIASFIVAVYVTNGNLDKLGITLEMTEAQNKKCWDDLHNKYTKWSMSIMMDPDSANTYFTEFCAHVDKFAPKLVGKEAEIFAEMQKILQKEGITHLETIMGVGICYGAYYQMKLLENGGGYDINNIMKQVMPDL